MSRTGTVIVEEGQDGAVVGELTLAVRAGHVHSWKWHAHAITDRTPESPEIARTVARLRRPFLRGAAFDGAQRNPIDGALLASPIDEVVGHTRAPLHRANPSDAAVPAVLEGTSHDLVVDAMRAMTGADIAIMRGFRFGTQIPPGAITRADLYHLLPIGAQVATMRGVSGAALRAQIESALRGVFDPDPWQWTGGWMFSFSGLTMDVDPGAPFGRRSSNIRVGGVALDLARRYDVAGLWFASEPATVNNCPCGAGASVQVLHDEHDGPLDAVEVVVRYLASLPDSAVAPATGRVRAIRPFPRSPFGFPVLQPIPVSITGASPATRP